MSLTPDDFFSCYTEFLHLLSPNALTWSFSLVTLFFHSLPLDLQEAVRFGGYILSYISQLYTSLLQKQALQILREYAVTAFELLIEEKIIFALS